MHTHGQLWYVANNVNKLKTRIYNEYTTFELLMLLKSSLSKFRIKFGTQFKWQQVALEKRSRISPGLHRSDLILFRLSDEEHGLSMIRLNVEKSSAPQTFPN